MVDDEEIDGGSLFYRIDTFVSTNTARALVLSFLEGEPVTLDSCCHSLFSNSIRSFIVFIHFFQLNRMGLCEAGWCESWSCEICCDCGIDCSACFT